MIIAVTFTTTTGNVIRDTTDDFPTLEKATEELKNSLSRRNDCIFLNMQSAAIILNREHVVSIGVEAAQ